MNNSGNNGDSMIGGVLRYTTYSEEISIIAAFVDGAYENGGGGGWHMGASTMDGCDGRGGVDGWYAGASIEDAWNRKYGGGEWR